MCERWCRAASRHTNQLSDRWRFKVATLLILCLVILIVCAVVSTIAFFSPRLLISHAGRDDDPNHR